MTEISDILDEVRQLQRSLQRIERLLEAGVREVGLLGPIHGWDCRNGHIHATKWEAERCVNGQASRAE